MFCSSWKFSNEVTQTLMFLFTPQLEILEPAKSFNLILSDSGTGC